ncbi:MAG: CPBP family glutamic-type intramembrane protease [Candidatus Aquicultorales bacterium]
MISTELDVGQLETVPDVVPEEAGDASLRVPWGIGEAIAVITAGMLVSGVLVVSSLIPKMLSDSGVITLPLNAWIIPVVGMLVSYALYPLLAWVFAIKIGKGSWSDFNLGRFSWPGMALVPLLLIGVLGFTLAYENILAFFGVMPSEAQIEMITGLFGDGLWGLATAVLIIALMAPFGEELLFRGFLHPVLRQSCGPKAGVLASGFVFSLVHVDTYAFLPLMVIGMALAWLYQRSRSLWPPIVLHALNNLLAIVVMVVEGKLGA